MVALYLSIAVILAIDTVLLALLAWAFKAPRFAGHRIQVGPGMQVNAAHRMKTSGVSSVLSLVIVLGGVFLAMGTLIVEDERSWARIVVDAVAVLVVYDFAYYFAHRAMHHPKALRFVHGIHHRARNPSVLESFYQHPAELVVGLALLFLAIFVVGPIHAHTFALVFFLYSTLNILVHSGLFFGVRPFGPIDFLTKKHFVHHHDDPQANFSTLTALPDFVFGTVK
jgi:sterol desaturase/sphingolipid hydroxylase (fatty acid hydroxylase superfamily)